jgi:protein-S-isoprenylcysteine O-methyltransferase Ste14
MAISKILQRLRVFTGYVFAVIFLIFCRPTFYSLAIGLPIAFVGLIIRAWACGHLRKVSELDSSGPYAHTRNPLYLGSFLIASGFGVASASWWLAALAVIFFLGIYLPVMNVEKDELIEVLGQDYRDYARDVPAFIPRLRSWKKSGRRFDFRLYLKHREYNAVIGVLLAAVVLVLKLYLF